jgi:two-component system NtrC family sensor kinase
MNLNALKVNAPEQLIDELSPQIRACRSVEQACALLSQELYQRCVCGEPAAPSLVLSRIYLSLPFSALDPESQSFAHKESGSPQGPNDPFLTLLGTWGDEPSWRSRTASQGHRAIPLNRDTLASAPMLARCFQQIGFNTDKILRAEDGIHVEGVASSFGLFYVENAQGSPFVPAQAGFVLPYHVRTVIGCGTMLLNGAVSIWIGFTRHQFAHQAGIPFIAMMPAFWQLVQPLYRRRALYAT